MIVAKPTASAKALFAEWQGAEATTNKLTVGRRETERAYLLRTILREGRIRFAGDPRDPR